MERSLVAGIFVGGAAARMGGRAKGLMLAPEGVTIVERWRAMLEREGARVVLVGARDEYSALGMEALADDPPDAGPLGGLVSLLAYAGAARALALACDMPFVSRELVARLVAAEGDGAVVAPRRAGRWEPLCARYDAAHVLPVARRRVRERDRSLQRLLEEVGARELPLSESEIAQLDDWDTPEDVT